MTLFPARRLAKAAASIPLPLPAWVLMLTMLCACQSQATIASSGDHAPASPEAFTVLEIAQPRYQPREGAGRSRTEESACAAWSLDRRQAESLLALSEPLPEGRLHDFHWLPCSIGGRLQAQGREWTFEINGAGTSVLRSGDDVRLLGCSSSACEPFVILMPDVTNGS